MAEGAWSSYQQKSPTLRALQEMSVDSAVPRYAATSESPSVRSLMGTSLSAPPVVPKYGNFQSVLKDSIPLPQQQTSAGPVINSSVRQLSPSRRPMSPPVGLTSPSIPNHQLPPVPPHASASPAQMMALQDESQAAVKAAENTKMLVTMQHLNDKARIDELEKRLRSLETIPAAAQPQGAAPHQQMVYQPIAAQTLTPPVQGLAPSTPPVMTLAPTPVAAAAAAAPIQAAPVLQPTAGSANLESTNISNLLASLQKEVSELREDHNTLKEQCRELHSDHSELLDSHENLKSQCSNLHTELQESTCEAAKTEKSLKQLEEVHEALQEQCRELHTECTSLETSHDSLKEECRQLHTNVEELDHDFSKLKNDCGELHTNHEQLETNYEGLKEQCRDLHSEVASQQSVIDEVKGEATKAISMATESDEKNAANHQVTQNEMTSINEKLSFIEQNIAEASEAAQNTLQHSIQSLQEGAANMSEETKMSVEVLTRALEASTTSLKETTENLTTLREQCSDLQSGHEELRTEFESLKSQCTDLHSDQLKLEGAVGDLDKKQDEERKEIADKLDVSEKELSSQIEKISEALRKNDIGAVLNLRNETERNLQDQQHKYESLAAQLDASLTGLSATNTALQRLNDRLNYVDEALDGLRGDKKQHIALLQQKQQQQQQQQQQHQPGLVQHQGQTGPSYNRSLSPQRPTVLALSAGMPSGVPPTPLVSGILPQQTADSRVRELERRLGLPNYSV